MILIDAGPLVAMTNPREKRHKDCVDILERSGLRFTTTMVCLAEAFYLLGESMGIFGHQKLFAMIESRAIQLFDINAAHFKRLNELMVKYQDTPMDLADASLVVVAEALGTNKIFTLDSDFNVYRINGRKPFEIIR